MTGLVLEYPYALLIVVLFIACLYFCKPKATALYFPNLKMLKSASKGKESLLNLLKFLIAVLLALTLASPVKQNTITIKNDKGYEISLILDASGSMREYNKFDIVKEIVEDFIKKRKSDKLALSIFADFAYVAVPLTYDKKSILRLLERVEVGIAGERRTALYEALFLSSNLFKDSHAKNKIAILLTDGMDNVGNIPLDVAIKRAKKYGIKVYTIGVGGVGDFNPAVLRKITKETGGEYFSAGSVDELKRIYKTIDKLEKSEIKVDKYVKKSYFYGYPLSLALLLMLVYWLLTNRRVKNAL